MAEVQILIAEDERVVAQDLRATLERLGYAVAAVVSTGKQAVEKAAETNPDLALVDVGLTGEMDSVRAAVQIRSELDIPVIFVTADADEVAPQRAQAGEPFGYVLKPFDENKLHVAVEVALYRHQMERRLRQREEEISRRNRALSLLNQVIATSASGLGPEPVLGTACRELARAFDAPWTAAALLNEKRTKLRVVAEHRTDDQPSLLDTAIEIGEDTSFQTLLADRAPLAVDGTHGKGAASSLVLPIIIREEVVGSLSVGTSVPRFFSQEEVDLAWSVAQQVGGTLARARAEEKRRELEEKYHQAQKLEALGRLTGDIAHEFNNLLTVINGFAEFVQLQLPPDSPFNDPVTKIRRAGRSAADLVRQLLVFSRTQVIETRVLDLNQLVAEMDDMLRPVIGEHILMATVLEPDLWSVKVDPAQFGLVIINLVLNARDAMPGGGKLTIETGNVVLDGDAKSSLAGAWPGEYVALTVSDTGIGMSEDVKTHIFEPFFTTKAEGEGLGLGLATVQGIVHQSGGHISCHSEAGIGTTFQVYLPRAQTASEPGTRPRRETVMPRGGETLLLVEDDSEVRAVVREVLRAQGYVLLEAGDGQEALELANGYAAPIHLLLTDVVMPGMSGQDLAGQLGRTRAGMKTLFISGHASNVITKHGVPDSGVALLQKPFGPATLARKVRNVLDG